MAALECQVPAFAEAQKPQAEKRLRQLDRDLGATSFIAGDRFTIADITAFTTLTFFPRLCGITIDGTLPNILRWLGEVGARPSASA
jgi:glutathione S-transferase